MDLTATVHLDSQVDFLPTVPGLTVQFIIVINTGNNCPTWFTTAKHFYRAMRCISAVFAVIRCPSVCVSVCHVRGSRQNE